MSRRRAKPEAPKKRTRHRPPAEPRPPISIPAFLAAASFALISAAAFVIPTSPFPAGISKYWLVGTLVIGLSAGFAARLPIREFPSRLGAFLRRPSSGVFGVIVGITTAALGVLFAFNLFNGFATTSDEIAQLWHAKMLVHGHLALPADANPEFFAIDNVVDTGRWYSEYPIGGPAVVALGLLLHAPWLVNPLLAGLAAIAMYHFGRRAFGETEGRAIGALFAVSPMIVMMAGSRMNHVPVLACAAGALAALVEWDSAPTRARGFFFATLVGLAVGIMATIRPVDALVVAASIGVFQLFAVRRRPERWTELGAVIGAGVIGVLPLLIANARTTGSPFRFGYEVLWGNAHRLGFHADPQGGVHTLGRAFEYAVTYVNQLDLNVTLWPVPILLVIIAGLLTARRLTRWDGLLLGLFWLQVVAYAAYWFQGEFLGPRFLFTALTAVIVFVARAPISIGRRYGPYTGRTALVFALVCIVIAWGAPNVRFGVWGTAKLVRSARPVLQADFEGAVRDANVHNALVFMREPFRTRLLRRMWGVGISRSDAAQLLEKRDACSLLTAVRAAEGDSSMAPAAKAAMIARDAAPYVPTDSALRASFTVHISSVNSLTPACRQEIDDDARMGGGPFGPVLPLEPIGPDGRLSGDVIYAADLGEHNDVLRKRFGDRTWYRLLVKRAPDRSLHLVVEKY
ncbi:MAG TPA: hypothetical protein VE967_02850 [Gemmatimonadaceae bacterium]|nr:hypothetical protein [Gemmatimonadaceae bacterium]